MTSSPDPSSAKQDLWPCPVARSSMRQSDEGCSPDLFKTDQKKGVGYVLLIIQPSLRRCTRSESCSDQSSMHTTTLLHPSPFQMLVPCKKQGARIKLNLVYRPLLSPQCKQSSPSRTSCNPASHLSKQHRSSPQSTCMVCLHTQDVAASYILMKLCH